MAHFSSVQSLSHVRLFVTPWTAACQAFLSITNSWSLIELMSIELVTNSSSVAPSPPAFNLSQHQGLLVLCIRWPKYWSFSFSISPSNEYSGLISLRIDWLDLLTVRRTLESSTHSSKASILGHSGFFMVQLSYSYMTTGKSIALTRWTFVGKVMSLLFNMLSRLVIAFLSRSKHLLIHGCSHRLSGMVAAHLLCYFVWEVHSCFFVCFEYFVYIWNFEYYNVDLLISQGLPICDG